MMNKVYEFVGTKYILDFDGYVTHISEDDMCHLKSLLFSKGFDYEQCIKEIHTFVDAESYLVIKQKLSLDSHCNPVASAGTQFMYYLTA